MSLTCLSLSIVSSYTIVHSVLGYNSNEILEEVDSVVGLFNNGLPSKSI